MVSCSTQLTLQERTLALEAELAQSSAQLQQLQALQTSLTTRNQLLEKLLRLNKQAEFKSRPEVPQSSAVSLASPVYHGSVHEEDPNNTVSYVDTIHKASVCNRLSVMAPFSDIC